jgi:erythritol transport system ATP-binding protein
VINAQPQVTSDEILLQAKQITKVYPGTIALKAVDFNIYRGKANVLIGENGAGKSTLMKILAGVERASSGQLMMNGAEIQVTSPRDANRHGIGIIYQELNLYPNLSVAENIFMSHQLTRFGTINEKAQQAFTRDLMQRLEQQIDPKTIVISV